MKCHCMFCKTILKAESCWTVTPHLLPSMELRSGGSKLSQREYYSPAPPASSGLGSNALGLFVKLNHYLVNCEIWNSSNTIHIILKRRKVCAQSGIEIMLYNKIAIYIYFMFFGPIHHCQFFFVSAALQSSILRQLHKVFQPQGCYHWTVVVVYWLRPQHVCTLNDQLRKLSHVCNQCIYIFS